MSLRNTLRATLTVAALALVPIASFATSGTSAELKGDTNVSIPFANHGGIRDWQADKDRGLWVQDIHRKWFYATLMSPCIGLNFANTIGFDTQPMGTFDKWSAILVPRWGRCNVTTLVPSDGPPRKQKVASAEDQPKAKS